MTSESAPIRHDLPERTFEFARRVVVLCQATDQTPGVSRTLANQLLRAGISIGANVEEGQASQSRADFTSKYAIACKEARETHYWLRLVGATGIVERGSLESLVDEASQLIAILTTIVKKTRQPAPDRAEERRVKSEE
ncbi:MAG: four helix bundle protein [Opitutaceae bacterium]